MSLKTRIDKLETVMGRSEIQGMLEMHACVDDPCPMAGGCSCLPCERPDHDPNCRITLRTPLRGSGDVIRVYGCWPCGLE
jgi:hypothetical protein